MVTDKIYDASGFVILTDVVQDVILEMRYFSSFNFTGRRAKNYLEPIAIISKEAALALKDVSRKLKEEKLVLKVYDAYRPQSTVDSFVDWSINGSDAMKPYFYPKIEKNETFSKGYLIKRSSHSKGSAIDVTLVSMKTGEPLDMGGPYDFFDEISHPDYKGIKENQFNNRMLLREIMLECGFEPLETEWWHFTLKDEPFKDIYFDFPVAIKSITAGA